MALSAHESGKNAAQIAIESLLAVKFGLFFEPVKNYVKSAIVF